MSTSSPGAPDPLPYAVLLQRVKTLRSLIRDRRKEAPNAAAAESWKAWERNISEELRSHPLNEDLMRLAERLERALKEPD